MQCCAVQVWNVCCLAAEERAAEVTGGSRVCCVKNLSSLVVDDDVSQLTEEVVMLRNTQETESTAKQQHIQTLNGRVYDLEVQLETLC